MDEQKRASMLEALEQFVEKEGLGKIEYLSVRWNEQVHKDVKGYIQFLEEAHERTKKSRLKPWVYNGSKVN